MAQTKSLSQTWDERWQQIIEIWFKSQIAYAVFLVFIGVLVGRFLLFPLDEGYSTNIYTELLSLSLTIFVLDRLSEQRINRTQKQELIFRLGSNENVVAREAARMLRHKKWLQDGSINLAFLGEANLENCDLNHAKLEAAHLWKANLAGANMKFVVAPHVRLGYANLRGAKMFQTNFREAILTEASLQSSEVWDSELTAASMKKCDLEGATLWGSILAGADLQHAKLYRADLQKCDLRGANLAFAMVERTLFIKAVLPDGTEWSEGIDIGRFTDPEHPQFQETLQKINEVRKELDLEPLD